MGLFENFFRQLARPFVPRPPAVSASSLSSKAASKISSGVSSRAKGKGKGRAAARAAAFDDGYDKHDYGASPPGGFAVFDSDPGFAAGLSPLCESFFAEVCSLRSETPPPTASFAAGRVLSALDAAERKARRHPGLERAFRGVRADLVFFADYALSRSVPGWRPIAEERMGIVTGEELFCNDAERALEDGLREEAEVFRACAGLGFSGAEAVGAERWRRTAEALARLAPAPRPDRLEAANPAPAPGRSGPVRRTPWLAVFFLTLAALLAALTVWQIVRAPGEYRGRMAVLRTTVE